MKTDLPTEIKINKACKWLPGKILEKISSGSFDAKYLMVLSRAEKKVLRKHKRIPVSQWAEKHRVLHMSSLPGPWKNSVTPYLTGIMDAAGYPFVKTVTLCKSPQTGGSEAVHNFIGYIIDRAPGPVLYVYPDELTGRENSKDRILPMIESSPQLRGYMTGQQDDSGMLRVNLMHMPIYIAWARSASRLANKPIRYIVFDETDKYPETSGPKEADPISLGEARKTTYSHNHKIFKISSPTTEANFIWQAMTIEAEVIFDYWVKCPSCGRYQRMIFENIKVPEKEREPNRIEKEKLAWYACNHCDARWNDMDRNEAVSMGKWRERLPDNSSRTVGLELFAYIETRRPAKIAFHIPSWLSGFVSLSKIMADWFMAIKDRTKMKDFKNKHEAVPWLDYNNDRTEDRILALRDERPRGVVPDTEIVAITAGIDTQQDGFWYEIRAWGAGVHLESWQVREGFCTSFEALTEILFDSQYLDVHGNRYMIHLAIIDAMGDKTAQVYEYCRQFPGRVVPFQGVRSMTMPYRLSKIEYYPGTDKIIPGGIRLLRGNVTYYKNNLSARLDIASSDPGAWHYHSETSMDWARQMTAEYLDDHGFWECKYSRANHGWDCSVYNLLASDVIGVRNIRPGRSSKQSSEREEHDKNRKPGSSSSRW